MIRSSEYDRIFFINFTSLTSTSDQLSIAVTGKGQAPANVIPPMKIAFVNPHFGYMQGGAEVNDRNLGLAFTHLGHSVSYLFASDPAVPVHDNFSPMNAEPVEFRYWYKMALGAPGIAGKLLRHTFEKRFTRALLKQKKQLLDNFDLILLTGRPLLSEIRKATNTRVLQSIRGIPNARYFRHYAIADAIIYWGGCKDSHPEAATRLAPAIELNAAIEADYFYPGPPNTELRQQLLGPLANSDVPVILSTSRLDPIQQVDQIIEACASLPKSNLPFRLVIAGDGQASDMLELLARRVLPEDSYTFIGRQPREMIGELQRAADVFVMNPAFTSYSLALKEAVACGIYAIAPKTGTVAHSILDYSHASIFPVGDASALQRTLKRTLEEKSYREKPHQLPDMLKETWESNAQAIIDWSRTY